MANTASGQMEPNPVMWLATRASNSPLGITRYFSQENDVLYAT